MLIEYIFNWRLSKYGEDVIVPNFRKEGICAENKLIAIRLLLRQ